MTITLTPGTLPPPACYAEEQERFDAYVAAIIASVTGGIQWEVGSSAPSDTTKYWLVTDTNGRPLYAAKYSTADAAWVRFLTDVIWCGDATGTLGNYQVAPIPVFTTTASAYAYGRMYAFKVPHNNPGAATLNVNSLGQRDIKKLVSTALAANDVLVGQLVIVVFDGTAFQLMVPVANRTITASDITPGTDEQTLSSVGGTPATKWQTRQYATATANMVTVPAGGTGQSFTHGLQKDGVAVKPKLFQVWFECTINDPSTGHIAGDRVNVETCYATGATAIMCAWSSSTEVGMSRNGPAGAIYVNHKTTGAAVTLTEANWKMGASASW